MKVILTEKVASLGNVGDIVNVSQGYGRNYLIPNNKAVLADEAHKKQVENQKRALANKVAAQKSDAEALATKVNGVSLTIEKRVAGSGALFGSVTAGELAHALRTEGLEVEKRNVIAPAIKTLGEFKVQAELFAGVNAEFSVTVVMDPKQVIENEKKAAEAKKAKEEEAAKAAAAAEAGEGEEKEEAKEMTEEQKLKAEADRLLRSF